MPDQEYQFQGMGWWFIARRVIFGITALLFLLVALPGLLRLGGLQLIAVNGHSMGQAVPDQSVVIARSVRGEALRAGDVVVFGSRWLDETARTTNVVHRLSLITVTQDGLVGYTSGDANAVTDPLPLKLQGGLPLVKTVVPFAGIFYGLSSKIIFLGAIGLILLLMVSYRPILTKSIVTRSQRFSERKSATV